MSHYDKVIEDLKSKLITQESEIKETKNTINALMKLQGKPALYTDLELATVANDNIYDIQPDKWYGQPLAKAAREFLKMRKSIGKGAASLDEVYDALTKGGFNFPGKDDGVKKRGLSITLGKNSKVFHKLPNENIGLLEWYPDIKASKSKLKNANNEPEDTNNDELLDDEIDDITEDSQQ